jgi:hypothetical protein
MPSFLQGFARKVKPPAMRVVVYSVRQDIVKFHHCCENIPEPPQLSQK